MKIVLIVGSSGVGKDSLLKEAKKVLKKEVNFVRRYITRKPDKNEKNFFLDISAFELLQTNNFFISSWSAHNNFYGIGKNSIKNELNIVSISRSRIKDFETLYDNVYTINISVPKDVLKGRLKGRGRENSEEIEKRLNRSYLKIEAKNLIEFDNSKPLHKSSKTFIKLLKDIKITN